MSMQSQPENIEQQVAEAPQTQSQKSYLVVADESDEFRAALYYALNLAQLNQGHVSIAHIQNLQDFMHWGNVENMVRGEMRKKSEELLWTIASECNTYNNHIPSLYSREGHAVDVITDILDEDPRISALVLAASTKSSNPGPLVKHFASKVVAQLKVPLIVVPGDLSKENIEKLI